MRSLPFRPAIWARCLLVASVFAMPAVAGDFKPIPNPSFDQGSVTPGNSDAPLGWTLSGGKGRWVDRDVLEVTGSGTDSNFWRCDYRFTPGVLYQFDVIARHVGGSGCVVAGPAFANRDRRLSSDWEGVSCVFRVPDNIEQSYFRLGQWQATGTVQFRGTFLHPSVPIYTTAGKLLLGEDESIRDGRYTFAGTFGHKGSNFHRTLHRATAGFNSDRWTFGNGSRVTYRFELPGHKFLDARVSFNVNYHTRGGCTAEVSVNGKTWKGVGVQEKVGTCEAEVPDDLVPTGVLYVRLGTSDAPSSFQVNRVEFSAQLSDPPADAAGNTDYAIVCPSSSDLTVGRITWHEGNAPDEPELRVEVKNAGSKATAAKLDVVLRKPPELDPRLVQTLHAEIAAGGTATFRAAVSTKEPGEQTVDLSLVCPKALTSIFIPLSIPDYYRADYGGQVEGTGGKAAVWWCHATHKIPQQRSLPKGSSPAAWLSAARNEREPVQVVVRPAEPLKGLTAAVSALTGPDGATIPAENVKVLRVAYHFVHSPTDATGIRDYWPDALPPLDKPIDLPAGKNQPLWVLVHVPEDAKAGDYKGELSLKAEGWSAKVPIKLHVWNFTLPKENHIETAFGFSPGNVFRYHQLKTDEDKRRVLDMYLKCYAEHRISPYNPAPMDPIGVRFDAKADPPRAELDFSRFDPAFTRAVEQFHFTGIRLPIQGMGGGTFHSRSDPKIGDFGEETPEYKAMFSSYVRQLEGHFRKKGWLDKAYIYWFDEPAPKDYDFVANGMKRLRQYAPGLRRMLTEEPADNVLAGTVDIWCPVSYNYDHEAAEKRRAHGERFWWYVCCGPKAPYCTLFIDHPATELRTWLWQTWQRKIDGILVWQATYWTSSAAFPDPARPQNPYEDPMGYVSGYSTPAGTKRFWGNGDGRFVYPPESAAVPGISGDGPVIEPPVSSIRWEMLREGIEDWEYLYMLRELITKHRDELTAGELRQFEPLLEVPESITRDMTTFTTDPVPIYRRRKEIAEAIEALERLQP